MGAGAPPDAVIGSRRAAVSAASRARAEASSALGRVRDDSETDGAERGVDGGPTPPLAATAAAKVAFALVTHCMRLSRLAVAASMFSNERGFVVDVAIGGGCCWGVGSYAIVLFFVGSGLQPKF